MQTGYNILDSVEDPVGTWTLFTTGSVTSGRSAYGTIQLVRRGPEVGYRAELRDFGVVGYYRSLLGAAQGIKDAAIVMAAWHRAVAPFMQSRQPIPPHLERPPIRVVGVYEVEESAAIRGTEPTRR